MAERRGFSTEVVLSDKFTSMPVSAQCLYFHIGIDSPDNGVLNNVFGIARGVGVSAEDVYILEKNGYLQRLGEYKWRITHWCENNGIGENAKKRNNYAYRKWREKVIDRDKGKCVLCGSSANLEVHHIKPFAQFPTERLNINNGVTLCRDCHKRVHKEKNIEWLYLRE